MPAGAISPHSQCSYCISNAQSKNHVSNLVPILKDVSTINTIPELYLKHNQSSIQILSNKTEVTLHSRCPLTSYLLSFRQPLVVHSAAESVRLANTAFGRRK